MKTSSVIKAIGILVSAAGLFMAAQKIAIGGRDVFQAEGPIDQSTTFNGPTTIVTHPPPAAADEVAQAQIGEVKSELEHKPASQDARPGGQPRTNPAPSGMRIDQSGITFGPDARVNNLVVNPKGDGTGPQTNHFE